MTVIFSEIFLQGGARVDGKNYLKHLVWSLLVRKTIAQYNKYLVPFMQALDFKK